MTIPASEIVQVNPGVLGSGGSPLALNGAIFSQSELIPVANALSFSSATAVGSYFGQSSDEYSASLIYFAGYDNSSIKPGLLYIAPYNGDDRAAWLRSGSFAGITLEELQGFSGILTLTTDGSSFTTSTINLATASSFSNAATMISTALVVPCSPSPICTWNPVLSMFIITSPTYGVASTISFASNTLSADLKLTSATGAILSQGADEDTPNSALTNLVVDTQNWVTFTTLWEPDLADKTLFAIWANAQNSRYLYVCWDTDAQAIVNGSTTCFGAVAKAAEYDGVEVVYNTLDLAVLQLAIDASINFAATNGRITAAFKSQSGFIPTVTDAQIAANLLENGYSFYGSYATANDQFNFFYNGNLPGKWLWNDTFVDQVYLNSQFQLALLSLLTSSESVPYNQSGYSLIRTTMQDPINQMLNFGGIRAGISLSESQKAQVNQSAGLNVAGTIEQQGYYLQVLDPGAQVRGNRGTPVINFWYTDGGAVQQITLASIDII